MSRIDLVGQNGADGEVYLVEAVCRIIAGDRADRMEFPKSGSQRGWQVHIQQAVEIIKTVREHDGTGN